MALRLRIVSRQAQALGERGSKEFGHNGGTIGRSLESDWVLPDAQRYLSSRHASIDFRSGSYYVVDTSTNGVYVNGDERPVGRGNPQRLFTGDRVRMGDYEIGVEIDEDDGAQVPPDSGYVDPVTKAQRVSAPEPSRADLIAAHEITSVGIEMLIDENTDLVELHKAAKVSVDSLRLVDEPAPVSAAGRVTPGRSARAQPAAPAAPPSTAAPAPGAPSATPAQATRPRPPVLNAFFRGAGLEPMRMDDREAELLLHSLGQVMREIVLGLSENLHVRAEQKNVLRQSATTIQPRDNNPLKFSASVEEALTSLLLQRGGQYLLPVEAVRQTFADIKRHQLTLLAAVKTAVDDYVGQLDPDELEKKFSGSKRLGFMNAANKLKYWDLYRDLYHLIAMHEPAQFSQAFLDALTRAYETADKENSGPSSRTPRRPATNIG